MDRNTANRMSSYQLAILTAVAAFISSVTALAVILMLRLRRQNQKGAPSVDTAGSAATATDAGQTAADQTLIQPAVSASTLSEMPDHFSEDLIVPGHTFTGPEIEEHDGTLGRSPEGV